MSLERFRSLSAPELATARRACAQPGPPALARAIRQFNSGDYFACHETLEELWREERGAVRRVYQGLLHIAVGFYHLRRGNRHGALTKLRSGLDYLAPFPARCHEIDLEKLRAETAAWLRAIEAASPDQLSALSLPAPQLGLPAQDAASFG
ncbi:MAG: DUF309 domain-containing protein [Chloroflexota bacterium]|nr:DUF309 domain-containing protein [Dehalococcoidia bacterium]MDW8254800.1 DUF309 domain-containing protein [Chloroflexota bacterium]